MKCPRCSHENRATAKFCEQCATPLSRTCSSCGSPLPDKAKFCPECAHPARRTAASRHASADAARRQRAAPPAGERRQAAVLFADISGYTALCASMDAEHVQALLNRFYALTDRTVAAYGGSIIDHAGDGVLAVFGAPVAYGNDPERAVRAALELHSGAAQLRDAFGKPAQAAHRRGQRRSGGCRDLGRRHAQVRDHRRRGESRRPAGCARRTRRHAGIAAGASAACANLVDAEDLGEKTVKGFDDPVRVYRIASLAARHAASACRWSAGKPSCVSLPACSTACGTPAPARPS